MLNLQIITDGTYMWFLCLQSAKIDKEDADQFKSKVAPPHPHRSNRPVGTCWFRGAIHSYYNHSGNYFKIRELEE